MQSEASFQPYLKGLATFYFHWTPFRNFCINVDAFFFSSFACSYSFSFCFVKMVWQTRGVARVSINAYIPRHIAMEPSKSTLKYKIHARFGWMTPFLHNNKSTHVDHTLTDDQIRIFTFMKTHETNFFLNSFRANVLLNGQCMKNSSVGLTTIVLGLEMCLKTFIQ